MGRLKEASCREITWSDLVFLKGISEHFVERSRGGQGSRVRKLPQSLQVTDGGLNGHGGGERQASFLITEDADLEELGSLLEMGPERAARVTI